VTCTDEVFGTRTVWTTVLRVPGSRPASLWAGHPTWPAARPGRGSADAGELPQITVHLGSGAEVVIVEGVATAVTGANRLRAFLTVYKHQYSAGRNRRRTVHRGVLSRQGDDRRRTAGAGRLTAEADRVKPAVIP
jgi:hypothetical protein